MSYDVAYVREQGMNFVVVCVADHIAENRSEAERTWRSFQLEYGVPTAIIGASRHRIYGDKRIVSWLSSIDLRRLPWQNVH